MRGDKLTIKEIAALAGVSRSTVSRVLNEHPDVSAKTRQQVSQVIAETGFSPNPIARSLSSQKSGIIGLVIPLTIRSLFEDPFFPRFIQGISQSCNAHDYTLSLFLFHSQEEEAKLYPRIARRQLLDGVIVAASQSENLLVPQLVASQIPFVMHGRHEDPGVSFVQVDNVNGATRAVTHLIRRGCRRIATITGRMDSLSAVDRKQGYLIALWDRGYPIDEKLIIAGDFTEMSGYEAMQRLLAHKPDAVFVASDTMALGALRALREAKISVPKDIALVGFDDLPHAATADPPLTTVRQPIRRAGALAVETLIDIMYNGLEPTRRIIMPTELVIRVSCGAGQIGQV